jgi:hypothetical protein
MGISDIDVQDWNSSKLQNTRKYANKMNPAFVAPFVIILVTAGYFMHKLRNFFLGSESEDYEHDENQTTRIRHEAGL